MTPRSFSTTGLIIRTHPLGESDRFVTLFTKSHGKLTCIAKGIRSVKSRRSPHVELLNRVKTQLWKSRHHYYLTQCTTEERFPELKAEIASLSSGAFMAEVTEKLTGDDEENPQLYNLLNGTLALMDFYPDKHKRLREAYLLKMLNILGYITSFRSCSACKKPLPETSAYLNRNHSTLQCTNCRSQFETTLEEIPLNTLKLMHFILERPIDAVLKVRVQPEHINTMSEFGRVFLYKNLHFRLKSEAALDLY